MREVLIRNGITVFEAENGLEGLHAVYKYSPDLIILDILLPEMDGYEVFTEFRSKEETKNIPIIFITTLTETKDKIRGFGAGGEFLIVFPGRGLANIEPIFERLESKLETNLIKRSPDTVFKWYFMPV